MINTGLNKFSKTLFYILQSTLPRRADLSLREQMRSVQFEQSTCHLTAEG